MRKFFTIVLVISLALPLMSAMAKEAEYSSIGEEQQATAQSSSNQAASGQSSTSGNTSGSLSLKIFTGGSLQTILDRAKGYIFAFGLVAAVIMILWAGIEFITSAGDPKKVTAAKNRIKNTLIGVVVMILAEGVILVLRSILAP